MDSITRIKQFIQQCFPKREKVDFSEYSNKIDFRTDLSELYRIPDNDVVLISYTNISITGTERQKPQPKGCARYPYAAEQLFGSGGSRAANPCKSCSGL